MKESIKVLQEAIELQKKKSLDYQNPNSHIKQAHHYPRGISTILDMVHQKITRMYSLTESGHVANFESIEDSAIDAINYLSFLVEYSRGKMDGQDSKRDAFNKPKVQEIRKHQSVKDALQEYYKHTKHENDVWEWREINPCPNPSPDWKLSYNPLKTMLINDGTYRSNTSSIAAVANSSSVSYMHGNMNND